MQSGTEGELAINSQVKGLGLDDTLESIQICTDEVNLSGKGDRARREFEFYALFLLPFCHVRQRWRIEIQMTKKNVKS